MKKIAVVGSINSDYFVEADVLPKTGETILGKNFFRSLGGKGANQAVAASRLGAQVSFFGSVGNDENGYFARDTFIQENIETSFLQFENNAHTGAAFIEISNSENRIIVIPGANSYTNKKYVENSLEQILKHDIFIFQLEIPMETIEYLIPILYEHQKIIIVNPAPAQLIKQDIIDKITYLTPNEHEYQEVLNQPVSSMEDALTKLPNKLMITCGQEGVKFFDGNTVVHIPAHIVKAVDTTGAGDTFCGAFAVALADGKELSECIRFGNIAAALSVQKKGAQAGMPFKKDVDQIIKEERIHDTEGDIPQN